MEKLKNTRILAAVGIACSILGVIMPYIKIEIEDFFSISKSLSLWGYLEGKIMMVLTLANFIFIFKDYAKKYTRQIFETPIGKKIDSADQKFSLIPTILVVILAIYLMSNTDIDFGSEYLKYGLGFYSLWIGAICLVAHAFVYKKDINTESVANKTVQPPTPYIPDINQFNQYQQPVQNNVKYCQKCGTQTDINAVTCQNCGNNF